MTTITEQMFHLESFESNDDTRIVKKERASTLATEQKLLERMRENIQESFEKADTIKSRCNPASSD